jgi:peptide/nickel transport system permease protein
MRANAPSRLATQVRANPALAATSALGIGLVLACALGPLLWSVDPLAMDFTATLSGPSLLHPFGTDANGRDILARVLAGGRISLSVSTGVILLGLLIGGGLGFIAGLARGVLDQIVTRTMDALAAFPPLILAMAITVGLGGGLLTASLGVLVSTLPFYVRLIRADVLRIRTMPFVDATIGLGASPLHLVLVHILPHTASTMLVQSAGVFGYAIMTLAGLSFVGLGAQIPTPEWGAMITDGLQSALTGAWWVPLFPGLGLIAAVITANVLADELRDRLDPHHAAKDVL